MLYSQGVDQAQHSGTVGDGIVQRPDDLRAVAQPQIAAQLAAQKPGGALQSLHGLLGLVLLEEADIDLGIPQVRSGLHTGDRDHHILYPGVLHIAQKGGKLLLDFIVDGIDAIDLTSL